MLQRSLQAALQWAPAALGSAGCHLQHMTAAQITGACCSSGTSRHSSSCNSSLESLAFCLQPRRCFLGGTVDVRGQARRKKLPYFNPDDGPEAYQYWKDLWAKPKPSPKPKRRKTLPVYLEPEEQQALLEAAVSAGVPRHLAEGDKSRQVPRLVAAVQAAGGRIPADPERLADRVEQLLELQHSVPGLDVARIFKAHGFGILAEQPSQVERQLSYLAKKLKAAGVPAEPGLLMTAAVKPALKYPMGLVERAQQLPAVFESELEAPAPAGLLQHPFRAGLLNKSSKAAQRHVQVLAQRHGKQEAAVMYSKLPQLLLYRTHNLRRKTAALAQLFGLNPAQADQLVRRDPRLMTYASETLQQRAQGLQEVLQLPGRVALRRLVRRRPSLLRRSTQSIMGKLPVIQEQLGLADTQEAAAVLHSQRCLASYSAAALQRPRQQLQQLADSSPLAPVRGKASEILRARPWLLTLGGEAAAGPQHSLAGRLQLLEQLAGISASWQQAVAALAGGAANDVAVVLSAGSFVDRLQWLLQQRPAQAPAAEEVSGIYGLVVMRAARFDRRYPGFAAQQAERQAVAEQAAAALAGDGKEL